MILKGSVNYEFLFSIQIVTMLLRLISVKCVIMATKLYNYL